MPEELKIGELAKKSGLTSRSIRYYEERKLIKPLRYSENGIRIYSEFSLKRLQFIRELKEVGLNLQEISEILKKADNCKSGSELVKTLIPFIQKNNLRLLEKINNYKKVKDDLEESYKENKTDY